MFRRIIKSSFLFIKRAVVVFCKSFFLTITGFRMLKVETICVNDAFLLSNGLLAIQWRAKNVVWVSIQRKWVGTFCSRHGANFIPTVTWNKLGFSLTKCKRRRGGNDF